MLLTKEPKSGCFAKRARLSKEHTKGDGAVTNPFPKRAHRVNKTKQCTPTKTDTRGEKQTGEERENDPSKHTLRLPIIQKWSKIVDVSRSDEEFVYKSRSALRRKVKETALTTGKDHTK